MDEISVVVPVYKVEEYLNRCVDSIINQTFRNLQIILVDDGSPDTCGKICDEYAEADSRIEVVHKKNGGLSDARNAGLSVARGKYIIFIDSDDYVENDMLEYLYANIKSADADLSTCGVYDVYKDSIVSQKEEAQQVCSGEEAFRYILRGHTIRGEIWNKLFRRECIGGVLFPVHKIYEDIFFLADVMPSIRKAVVGTSPKYYYIHREGSITGKGYRPQLFDIVEGYTKNLESVKEHFPSLEREAECLWLWSRFIVLDKMLLVKAYRKTDGYLELVHFLKSNILKILMNPFFNLPRKVSAVILFIHVKIYRIVLLRNIKKQKKLLKD